MIKENINKKQRGSLLIELMIGLLMSSLTILAIMTIYAQFEVQKRTTVQIGQTVSNAAIAMFPIQHRAKMAGYGISVSQLLGCEVKAYNADGDRDFSFTLLPVKITPGAGTTSDTVSFMYGSSDTSMWPIKLTDSSNSNNANIKVENKLGFKEGDLVILAEPGKNCNLAQVSGVHGTSDVVIRNSGNYTDPVTGKTVDIKYNKPGGLEGGEDYSAGATVINIGSSPETYIYTIANNQLVETNELTGTSTIIGDNVVMLKARYGLDADEDGTIENWTDNIGATANYKFLRAVKIGIIARTPLIEQKVKGACNATTNSEFQWGNETLDINGISDDWNCYRYRFIQSIIPLRNIIWSNE